ncbi:MAG TPA: SRPBCC family protein [Polyangiaceae bacterium]
MTKLRVPAEGAGPDDGLESKTKMNMQVTSADRIEKQILLRAPCTRVWRAMTDAREFGAWFQVELDNRFVEGETILGRNTHPALETVPFRCVVERLDPQRYLAFRWHPHAIDPSIDYSAEPMTLVEFWLEAVTAETKLTIVESGFDALPAERRDAARRASDNGWAERARSIDRFVTRR